MKINLILSLYYKKCLQSKSITSTNKIAGRTLAFLKKANSFQALKKFFSSVMNLSTMQMFMTTGFCLACFFTGASTICWPFAVCLGQMCSYRKQPMYRTISKWASDPQPKAEKICRTLQTQVNRISFLRKNYCIRSEIMLLEGSIPVPGM